MSIERNRARLRLGMPVEDENGLPVGRVVALEQSNFIVERPDLPTIALPYLRVAGIPDDQVRLNVKASEVEQHGYIVPEHGFRPVGQAEARRGMEVIGSDGGRIGQTVDVHPDYLTVDTGLGTQLYFIPNSAITRVEQNDNKIEVAAPAGEINAMGWQQPPATGAERAFHVQPGMQVDDRDGNEVGTVDSVHERYFNVRRASSPDFFIPYAGVQSVAGSRVTLNVTDSRVQELGWLNPPVGQYQDAGPGTVRPGMEVVSGEGDHVGEVQQAGEQEFLLHQGGRPELHVPYGYVRDVTVNRVVLSIPKADIPFMNWEIPSEGATSEQARP